MARGESFGDVLKGLGRDFANLALQEVKSGLLGGGSSSGSGSSIFGTLFRSAVGAFTGGAGGGLGAGISPTGSDIFGTPSPRAAPSCAATP